MVGRRDSGAADNSAGDSSYSDRDRREYLDNCHRVGGQHQDAKNGEPGGIGQSLLQYVRSRAVPSVSRMVCDKGGGFRRRARHGSGMGTTGLQPCNEVGSGDLTERLSGSCASF